MTTPTPTTTGANVDSITWRPHRSLVSLYLRSTRLDHASQGDQ